MATTFGEGALEAGTRRTGVRETLEHPAVFGGELCGGEPSSTGMADQTGHKLPSQGIQQLGNLLEWRMLGLESLSVFLIVHTGKLRFM